MGKRSLISGVRLPPGFRFHPTDEELVMYYLKRKIMGWRIRRPQVITEVDIYKYAPWDLPQKACLGTRDLKWYFFCPVEKKYASGVRMKRSTDLGHWKTTGKDRSVSYNNGVVGMIKTLIFHRGKAPKGERTDWVMHEYRFEGKLDYEGRRDEYVLCMIFKKDGLGPKNGAQYGAPFKEEDWDDDSDSDEEEAELDKEAVDEMMVEGSISKVADERNVLEVATSAVLSANPCISEVVEETNVAEAALSAGLSAPSLLQSKPSCSASVQVPVSICSSSYVSCPTETLPPAYMPIPVVSYNDGTSAEGPPVVNGNDNFCGMLDNFLEGGASIRNGDVNNENPDNLNGGIAGADPFADGIDIYKDLGDLGNQTGFCELWNMNYSHGNEGYLELSDLTIPLENTSELGQYKHAQAGGLNAVDNYCSNLQNQQPGELNAVNNYCSNLQNQQPGELNAVNNFYSNLQNQQAGESNAVNNYYSNLQNHHLWNA